MSINTIPKYNFYQDCMSDECECTMDNDPGGEYVRWDDVKHFLPADIRKMNE